MYADASPQMRVEIFGIHLESFVGCGIQSLRAEKMPGSTLKHGFSGLGQKVFNFLWAMWLMFGGSKSQLELAVSNVRCIVTDLGVEKGLASTRSCIDTFLHACSRCDSRAAGIWSTCEPSSSSLQRLQEHFR